MSTLKRSMRKVGSMVQWFNPRPVEQVCVDLQIEQTKLSALRCNSKVARRCVKLVARDAGASHAKTPPAQIVCSLNMMFPGFETRRLTC